MDEWFAFSLYRNLVKHIRCTVFTSRLCFPHLVEMNSFLFFLHSVLDMD